MGKLLITIILIVVIVLIISRLPGEEDTQAVTNFEECVTAGNLAMESHPRQCIHDGETFIEELLLPLSREEALEIARETRECSMTGILTDKIVYNENTKTWWIDLERMPELDKDGCNPACVVSEDTKIAELNMRCTGLLPPDSGVKGQVLLGPTCPVLRNPPDPECADKPYKTTVQVIESESARSSPFATVETDDEGFYTINLPAGNYAIQPIGGLPFPACSTEEITVEPNTILELNLSCDTGIR